MRALVAEAAGTALLVGVGSWAIVVGWPPAGVAAAFGVTAALLVVLAGPVSGAHCNPAVSVGLALAGRCDGVRVGAYVGAQALGGLGAASLLPVVTATGAGPAILRSRDLLAAAAAETVLAGLLVVAIVVLAERGGRAARALPAAVGLVVAAGVVAGVSLNPVRTIAPAVVAGDAGTILPHLAGPLLGAAIAAAALRASAAWAHRGVQRRRRNAAAG